MTPLLKASRESSIMRLKSKHQQVSLLCCDPDGSRAELVGSATPLACLTAQWRRSVVTDDRDGRVLPLPVEPPGGRAQSGDLRCRMMYSIVQMQTHESKHKPYGYTNPHNFYSMR